MAIIYSYPPVASLQTTDLFIISRTPEDPDEISNFSVTADVLASFVTSRVNLNFQGGVGTGVVNLDTQSLNVIGTTNEIETTANAQTLQIGLPDNVTITNNLTVLGSIDMTQNGRVINLEDPINAQDAATKSYVDTAVTGLLEFKGTFRADTGEILSGNNAGAYLYNCPSGAGTRVAVAVGDYYIVATAGGNFYCSGDLLNVGDSVYGVADAATDSSTINDWGTVEGDNIEGSGTANTIPVWTDSQILADSMLSQNVAANLLSVDGGLTATSFSTFQSGLQSDGPAYFYGTTQLGDAAADLVQVTGTLQLEGPIRDVNTDLGDADQILVSDAGGNVTWTDLTAVSVGTAQKTSILVKNIAAGDGGVTLTKGTPVYIVGSVGASERLYIDAADASNEAKMPCVGLLDQDLLPNGEGTATVTGKLKNLITSPIDGETPTENDTLYVKPGGGLTLTRPTGVANLIQNVGQVGRVSTSNDGNIVVSAILRTNDIPNLSPGKIWVGSTGNTIESGFVTLNEGATKLTVDGDLEVTSLTNGYIPFVNPSNVLANSAIYQDSDGHIGINVQPDPEHVFEVFDDRNENLSTDYSFYVTSEVASTPGRGAGGIQARVSDDGGTTYNSVVLVPGTNTGDLMSSNPLAFFANSDLDTSSATGFAGNIGTNGNWYLGDTFTTAPTEKLTVEGNVKIIGETFQFNFTGDVEHIFSIVPSTTSFGSGSSSLKFGKNNSATKGGGIAMGQNLISTGEQSQAFGFDNAASGAQSTVFGTNTTATGAQSFAFGNGADATGGRSFAGGFSSTASGLNSVALGNATTASGTNAMTMGATSTASGFNCFSFGLGITNSANASLAVGAYNVDSPGYKFSVGIGNSASARANAMAVRADGYIILDALKNSSSYNSDIAAAAGGVPLGALYRDGNTVKIRLT